MPLVSDRIWTPWRQIQANVVPMILSLPLLVAGVRIYRVDRPWDTTPLGLILAFPIVGWIAVNLTGLWSNQTMEAQLLRRLGRKYPSERMNMVFVGAAKPGFQGLLDPHQDVGFLIFHEDRLEYFGEKLSAEIPHDQLIQVCFRRNIHSALLLGRWIAIQYLDGGNQQELRIEPRKYLTLLGNRIYSKVLLKQLTDLLKQNHPDQGRGDSSGSKV